MSHLSRWVICNASTAASSASKSATNQRTLILRGASWSHPTSAASTTVFSIIIDGNTAFRGAGSGNVTALEVPGYAVVDANWGTSSPGGAVMAFTVWGDYR